MNRCTKLFMLGTLAFSTCSMQATVPMNEREAHAIQLLHDAERLLWGDVITLERMFAGPKKEHEQEALAKIRAALDTQYLPYKERVDALWALGASYQRKCYAPLVAPRHPLHNPAHTITSYRADTEKALEYYRKAVIAQQENIEHEQRVLESMKGKVLQNESYLNMLATKEKEWQSPAQ